MKTNFILSFLCLFLFTNVAVASFPVKRSADTTIVENSSSLEQAQTAEFETPFMMKGYDKWVAVAFWFFLGWPFAAHRWYAGKPAGWNILFILTIGGLGIWAIVDLVNILMDNFE